MVATRGGARTGADDQMEQILRKKPVRGTTARTTTAKTTKPATTTTSTMPKATRSKRLAPITRTQPEAELEESDDELQADEEPKTEAPAPAVKSRKGKATTTVAEPAKLTRRVTARVRKDVEAESATVKTFTKTTKPTTAKTMKAKAVELEKPDLPPPGQSRATRPTRATAAKNKTTPLSPKKITQVSRAPAKTTKGTTSKANTVNLVARPVSSSRPALRKRNLSDENAETPKLKPVEKLEDETEEHSTPQTPDAGAKRGHKEAFRRPKTPDQNAQDNHALQDDHTSADGSAGSDSELDDESEQTSSDELCGPKTPMKRCSPRESTRYTSAQKRTPAPHDLLKTPVRRFHVLGTQQGTPQTQKPYYRPTVPTLEVRPMTVARGQGKAMVFKPLEPLPDFRIDARQGNGKELESQDMESTVLPTTEASQSHPESEPDWEAVSGEETGAQSTSPHQTITCEEDVVEDSEDCVLNENADDSPVLDDSEATVIVQQDHEDMAEQEPEHSFELPTHLLTAMDDTEIDGVGEIMESNQDIEMCEGTPRPETLVWENVQQQITIPFTFDDVLRTPKGHAQEVESTEHSSLANLACVQEATECPTETGSQAEETEPQRVIDSNVNLNRAGTGSARVSLDGSVNLSDFIDIGALAESTRTQSTLPEQSIGMTEDIANASQGPSEDLSDDRTSEGGSPEIVSSVLRPFTSARDISELDIALDDLQGDADVLNEPLYARPTIASRRKSLPAIHARTPLFTQMRPTTADGASMPRVPRPFMPHWVADPRTPSRTTPNRPRSSTTCSMASNKRVIARTPKAMTPTARTPDTSVPLSHKVQSSAKTPVSRMLFARTPGTSVPMSPKYDTAERYPGLPSRSTYERMPFVTRTDTPELNLDGAAPTVSNSERHPGLPSRTTYELDAANISRNAKASEPATPKADTRERFPGLPHRRTYDEHAKTAMPVSRFRTPARLPTKRPATLQKTASLRRIALTSSSTPLKTPMKAMTGTPGLELMTPHPAAPLRGVVALVEVYTSDGGCATPVFTSLLQRLGAKTTKTFSDRVTHLIFKEGPPNTLQRLRAHNKQVAATGIGREIYCVNSRWVSDCDAAGMRAPEIDEEYAVDIADGPQSAKRRRKSMEPSSLVNLDGNVVRKSSLGRASLGPSSAKFASPSPLAQTTPRSDIGEKENSGDDGSPATPAYLSAPDSLVQQTAPANRVKKLDFRADKYTDNRRLTFWGGRT